MQRKASRQVKGSTNQRKTYDKIRCLHARVGSIRRDFLHKLTTYLAKTFKVVKIEDLKCRPCRRLPPAGTRHRIPRVKGMMANHKLAGAIADLGFYEFKCRPSWRLPPGRKRHRIPRRQLMYKCQMYGANLVLVDQWFGSSKTCSDCGNIQPMPLSERVYACSNCGMVRDRDWNASLNILNWELTACEE